MGTAVLITLALLALLVPFTPSVVAICRRHHRAGTILVINLVVSVFLGIPVALISGGLGLLVLAPFWFWIFVWAVMGEKRQLPQQPQLTTAEFLHNARINNHV